MSGDDRDLELPPISYVWQTPIRKPQRAKGGIDPGDRVKLTPAMRDKLQRMVAKAPEVMVKITGKTKTVNRLKAHFEYITRNGELAAETETGAVMEGRHGLRDIHSGWALDAELDEARRRQGPLSHNLVLSMPPGTDAVAVKDAVGAFAMETFGGRYDYVFVQHLDNEHPHVHLTVRSLGYEGQRLNPRKADLATWREKFAGELRLRGIEAEATPRRARGKIRKAERGVARMIRKRAEQPRVEGLARKEIVSEARAGKIKSHPWEAKARDRQAATRAAYRAQAEELERSGDGDDHELAKQLRQFITEMPALETKRDELRRDLAHSLTRRGGRAYSKGKERGGADDGR